MAMATTTYEMEAMIRGYHVYATVWDAQIIEELYCARLRETGNIRNPYAGAWFIIIMDCIPGIHDMGSVQ